MKIEKISTGSIKLDPTNPNSMSKQQLEALKQSIKKWGELRPIIIDMNNIVVDGEHLFKAYHQLGISEIPAIRLDIEGTDKRLLRQSMNKIRGSHNEGLDAEEYKAILENTDMQILSDSLAISEQEILNTINREDRVIDDTEEVEKLGNLTVKCPACGKVFKKGEGK